MRVIQSESSSGSNTDAPQLDSATKLQAWKEVVGGKSRGRVYGTTDFLLTTAKECLPSLSYHSLLLPLITQMAREKWFQNKLNEARNRWSSYRTRWSSCSNSLPPWWSSWLPAPSMSSTYMSYVSFFILFYNSIFICRHCSLVFQWTNLVSLKWTIMEFYVLMDIFWCWWIFSNFQHLVFKFLIFLIYCLLGLSPR